MKSKIFKLIPILLCLVTLTTLWLLSRPANADPIDKIESVTTVQEIINGSALLTEKEVPLEVIKEKAVYIEMPVYVKIPLELREFETVDKLDAFMKDNWDYVHALASEISPDSKLRCRYTAEMWQKYAAEKGYLLPMQLIEFGHLLDRQVSTTVGRHWGNVAIIQNRVYYIESVNEYQIVYVCPQD